MDQKPWYQSKTAWLNIAAFVALALSQVDMSLFPPEWEKPIAQVVLLLNLYLRVNGGSPLTLRKPQ